MPRAGTAAFGSLSFFETKRTPPLRQNNPILASSVFVNVGYQQDRAGVHAHAVHVGGVAKLDDGAARQLGLLKDRPPVLLSLEDGRAAQTLRINQPDVMLDVSVRGSLL